MKAHIESILDCPASKAWAAVQTSALFLEVIRPVLSIRPVDPPVLPERWAEAMTVRCRMVLFKLIPLGTHELRFERIDPLAREIQTRESDRLIKKWDHRIRIAYSNDGRTAYSDDVEIDAGLLTPFVWLFAHGFYRYRQRRWRNVARQLKASDAKGSSPSLP